MPKIDLAKRRRVMQRSQKLGHCICEPRRPCPCDVFLTQGICPCAGEKLPTAPPASVKLTELVHNAGCASKIPAAELEALLSRLPAVDDPAVLSGLPAGDDAGVYRLDDRVNLVQTVDVFTPCVDDPHTFGRICAANCLSDIYAMGARPRTALSILCFPIDTLDGEIMVAMLRGAMEAFAEARVALIGGHSVKDEEIKLGFAVTGTLDDAAAISHETARVGDELVLTKPLGTGVLSFCRQIGRAGGDFAAAEASMAELNAPAAEAMREVGVSAATDVTGFGLFGHLVSMARHAGVTMQVEADALPAFGGALEALRGGVVPGAIERNREYVADDIAVQDGTDPAAVDLGFDAQTSGGLLISVPAARRDRLLEALRRRNVSAWTIGRVVGASDGRIIVTPSGAELSASQLRAAQQEDVPAPAHAPGEPCCAEEFAAAPQGASGTAAHAAQAFGTLMRVTAAAGTIDERTKELIHFALAVGMRCGPCLTSHFKKAHAMGISREQLDEAAWCAVAMGGAPVKMFYQAFLEDAAAGGGGAKGCCP